MFYYIFLSIFEWWTFTDNQYFEKEANSWEKPLYIACVSPRCPHCQGIPQRFESFSRMSDDENNSIMSSVDCSKSIHCRHLGAKYLPYFVFIRGTEKKYWLEPNFNCPIRWIEFLKDYTSPTAIKIEKNEQFNELIEKSINGGSTFILYISNENNKLKEIFIKLSIKYRIFNSSFGYEINENYNNSKLRIYKSPLYFEEYLINELNLNNIIQENKFSNLHRFNFNEWNESIFKKKTGILMIDNEINNYNLSILINLSNKFGKEINFGWGKLKKENQISFKLGLNNKTNSYFALVDQKNQLKWIYNNNLNYSKIEYFINFQTNEKEGKKIFLLNFKKNNLSFIIGIIIFILIFIILYIYLKYFKIHSRKFE